MKDKTAEKSRPRAKFYVEKKGHFVHDAVLFLLLSVIFRLVGCWGLWTEEFFLITQMLLPMGSALLFVLILRFLGDKVFTLTVLPVLTGAAFFVIRALGYDNKLQAVLCIALCALVVVLYMLTAIGVIRTKWLMVTLFALALCYRIFVEDLLALNDTENPVLFSDGMLELSVICVLLGLMFAVLALKKRKLLEEANLPKIKDPVVIKPQKPAKPASAAVSAPVKPAAAPVSAPAKAETEAVSPAKPADDTAPAPEKPASEAEKPEQFPASAEAPAPQPQAAEMPADAVAEAPADDAEKK